MLFARSAHEGWDGGPLEILGDRSLGLRRRNLAEHATRHHRDVARFDAARWWRFLFWFPSLAAADRHGISLFLCCLVALAIGILIFHELNMVTVGFCAILIGLGVDFAILIFGRYQQARDEGADHRARHCRIDCKPRPRDFLRRADHGGRISRAAAERFGRLHATRRSDRNRHFARRPFHDDGFLSPDSAPYRAATW